MDAPNLLHVDLDAFYASVERRRRPELAGRPVAVGGRGPRGVVLSCSYEARAVGVRNGMPAARARRLCPELVCVPPDFSAYTTASRKFREILDAFTPLVEPLSLDEAFCDVAGAHRLYGPSERIADAVRARVRRELELTCSVGGGPTKLAAKLASRACKPDGVLVVHDQAAFLGPLPVGELWGVGAATAEGLRRIGLSTVGELAAASRSLLVRELGESLGTHLHALANGIDARTVVTDAEVKSVGAEETFDTDVASDERLRAELLRLSDRVASRLVASSLAGRTVVLKIRLAGFETHTRSRTLRDPTSDLWTINRTARDALESFRRSSRRRVRLLGVTVTGLVRGPVARQLSLESGPRYAEAEQALARVRRRFGDDAVGLAGLLDGATEADVP